jgi:hypothetical protein
MSVVSTFAPFLSFGAIYGYWIYQKKRLARLNTGNADKTVGAIARHLDLAVIEGDSSVNLWFLQEPPGDFERKIFLRGQPYGRQTTFQLVDGRRVEQGWTGQDVTQTFRATLVVGTNAPFPAFEVALRHPHSQCLPPLEFGQRTDLHEVSTGNERLDEMFVVRAADPHVGPALVDALTLLVSHLYVHMAGDAGRIWTSLTRVGLPYFAYAPDEALLVLATAACGLEGRRAPAEPVASMLNQASST